MGCNNSKSNNVEDAMTVEEIQRKQEAELQKLMHEKQVMLTNQARPLLASRNSMRFGVDEVGTVATAEVLRKRREELQAMVQREAKEENQWVVSVSIILIYEFVYICIF